MTAGAPPGGLLEAEILTSARERQRDGDSERSRRERQPRSASGNLSTGRPAHSNDWRAHLFPLDSPAGDQSPWLPRGGE